jgi:predicted RNA binding protein YcfA (HicA-like mRNA interferase family)
MPKKYRDVRKALTDAGWHVVGNAALTRSGARFGSRARIIVAGRDSDTVPAGTLGSIRRASGLENLR